MSTLHQEENRIVQYTKGAPDEVLKKCSKVWIRGKAEPLAEAYKEQILSWNQEMADRALRVLAAAFKSYDRMPESQEASDLENDLCFIGLTGMIDPVRPDVYKRQTYDHARRQRAGIRCGISARLQRGKGSP